MATKSRMILVLISWRTAPGPSGLGARKAGPCPSHRGRWSGPAQTGRIRNRSVDLRQTDSAACSRGRSCEKRTCAALIIALMLGSTLLAHAETLDRDKWVGQTGRANRACIAKFREKFGGAKDHSYATCMADQTDKEIETCTGNSDFSDCVREHSLKVLQACDLSKC